jgi:hypothetical protein
MATLLLRLRAYLNTLRRKNSPLNKARALITIAFTTLAVSATHARFDMDLDRFQGFVTVAPAVADVGTPRTITVHAVWPDACTPVLERAALEPEINPSALVFRFLVPETLMACAQVETRFSASVNFTPTSEGDLSIVAITQHDRLITRGKMLTLPLDAPGSDNLSGFWVGENGSSFLFLTHSDGSDAFHGSWNLFARNGTPHWQIVHSSRRTAAANTFEALLHDISVPAGADPWCGPVSACPRRGMTGRDAGALKVRVESADAIIIEALSTHASHPQLPVGTLLFLSSFTRMRF